jgi:myo-inositol-1-phosphate synthase
MALWGLKQSIGLHIRNNEELEPIIEDLEAALAQPDVGDSEIAYALEPDAVKISLAVQEAVKEAVAEERAACASLAEQMVALRVAKSIRARGEK